MPSRSKAPLLTVCLFFFFCLGTERHVNVRFNVSAGKSIQSSNWEGFVVRQSAVQLSCLFIRVIITRSDRGPDPCGSAGECLCLFVLHILKCLFVSLLEGPRESRIGKMCVAAVRLSGLPLVPLFFCFSLFKCGPYESESIIT